MTLVQTVSIRCDICEDLILTAMRDAESARSAADGRGWQTRIVKSTRGWPSPQDYCPACIPGGTASVTKTTNQGQS